MYETLGYEERGDIAFVTIKRTRINVRQIRELERVCDHLDDVSQAKVVVFRGHSEGIDFLDFDPKEAMDIHGFNKWEKLVNRIETLEKVTVALVDGPSVGGGFQILLACDQRICVPGATFQLPEVRQGFLPGMACYRLAKYVGLGHAKRIVMTGATIGADEALRLGLVDAVTPDLDAALKKTIDCFGPMHTVAFTLARRLLNESFSTGFEDGIGNFLAAQHRAISQTAFLDTLRAEHKKK
ncbi:MAG: enoyl-CoA hydratase/isomerase family protein [Deltaproteobacteria bacterium]|nr:enoyl-CoA hydratase/isomerase family protein [Deltaproteobacteria bacterium]MBM4391161.1 enoyl-CoA hydratase/isomerase family protein [Deltaproteobacteria bacterium]